MPWRSRSWIITVTWQFFIALLVEGFGVPAPGQTMLMAGAILAARDEMSIILVLVLEFLTGVLGNTLVIYWSAEAAACWCCSCGAAASTERRPVF